MIEGFRFVVRNPPIHALLMLLGVVSLTGMPYTVLMPIFADRILHGGADGAGLADGLRRSRGAGRRRCCWPAARTLKGLGRWVAMSSTAFGVTLVVFACSRVVLAFGRAFWCRWASHDDRRWASSNTLIQSMVPDQLRGRVMAVYSMMFMGMAPFGALLAGVAADRFGAPGTVTVSGVICLIAAVVFWTQLKEIRAHARRMLAEQRAVAATDH